MVYNSNLVKTERENRMFGFFLVLPLVIIIITGNQLRARGFYSADDISALMKTLYWVILPPLLFRTTYIAGTEVLKQPNLLIASTLCYILTIIVAYIGSVWFAHRGNVKRVAVSVFSSFRSNNIYLGFPVIQMAMGEAGLHETSIYVAVTTVSFQLLSIAAGEAVLYGRPSVSGILNMLKKLALNPLIISCVLGVIAASFGFPIHFVFDEAMKLMSGAATAVALLALGGSLDLSRMGKIVKILSSTWFDTLIKLAVNPAIMCVVLFLLPISKELFQVTVMLSAMPNAVNCFILARGMGMDSEYAADLVAATTLLGIISIPAWAYILGMV